MSLEDKNYLEIAIKAAVEAGNLLQKYRHDKFLSLDKKESDRDLVTQVDKLAEKTIVDILWQKGDRIPVLGEELGLANPDQRDDYQWIVDPIDGTVNYIHHIPYYVVSIALRKKEELLLGVIYNPLMDKLYYALKGFGAFKNNKRIRMKNSSFKDSLFAVAFSGKAFDPEHRIDEFKAFGAVNDSSRGCLRTGSAAQNLALVAEGKLGGCWGKANKIWDVAAGIVISELAGAKVFFETENKNKNLVNYCVASPDAYQSLMDKLPVNMKA